MEMADGDLGGVRLHPERNYFYALGLSRLADNPKLIENAIINASINVIVRERLAFVF